ncbi:excalibur calcium-binding domain-containing protein [Leifsonia sp. Leaf264]|uniref:excalibur calcium-binding domain-containing protein n=1 Tax=Leifsonia sp. Leaf264 TaxID=1736314 RepID=UPI0006FE876F|nr:excalibur calcium-binding domain-containing protein [Leifsonia sp. Leaf264]KQO97561.1 hypothetical protein ASF30_14145 [Leifsonia sp. Leaf264]
MLHAQPPARVAVPRRRILGTTVVATALVAAGLTGVVGSATAADDHTGFAGLADANLDACVRELIAFPEDEVLTGADVASLTGLDCPAQHISSLSGLEYATSLDSVILDGNSISDLSPLTGIATLTALSATDQVLPDDFAGSTVAGAVTILKPVIGVDGPVQLTVAADSDVAGAVDTDDSTVTWSGTGIGRLAWTAEQPVSGGQGTYSGSFSQAVGDGDLTPSPIPIVDGPAVFGATLTAVTDGWDTGVHFDYTWTRNGEPISDAQSSTYVLAAADIGCTIQVVVTGSKASFIAAERTSASTDVVAAATMAPHATISGTAIVGSTLSVDAGEWAPTDAVLAFQWKRAGTPIEGATASTYTLVTGDADSVITVTVTGTRTGYSANATTSAPTAVVSNVFTATPTPTIAGKKRVGETLTGAAGTWAPAGATLKYQWNRNGAPITTATTATYKLATADAGASITLVVTGSKATYATVARTSAPSVIEKVLTSTPIPTVSGTGLVGQVLTGRAGSWAPAGIAFSYQWKRNGVAIPQATALTYKLTPGDGGTSVTFVVTGSKGGYTPVTKTSAASSIQRLLTATPTPSVTGTKRVGQTLTGQPGTWAPTGVALTYQWKRNGIAIAGATASSYKLVAADASTSVTLAVTGSKIGYAPVTRMSAGVAIANGVFAATPTPTIGGTAKVGGTLTASAGTWSPAASIRFQWLRNGKAIIGATTSSYRVLATDVDGTISVRTTASKSGYTTVSKVSAGKKVAPIAYANCTALNAVYPSGVARNGVSVDRVSGRDVAISPSAFHSTALYNLNAKSDRDKDGIACEKR